MWYSASFLPKGSVTWLYYSDRLMQFPLGIFGVALATVVLPHLSRTFAKNDLKKYSFSVDWALKVVFLIATPASLGLFLLSEPLLIALFNYGKFTQYDVIQSAASLKAYSLGLLAFIFIKILASAFYAQKNTKTPVKIAAFCYVKQYNLKCNFNAIFSTCRSCNGCELVIFFKCYVINVFIYISKKFLLFNQDGVIFYLK